MDAEAAYQLIHDELSLDGSPALNLASFVHTWMPKQADQLMMENISKNLIDQDEYPMTRKYFTTAARRAVLTLFFRGPPYPLRLSTRRSVACTLYQ